MLGNNPIRPPVHSEGQELDVKEIYFTLQGEGPFTGQPAVFIRLGGCNLACSFCDTDFESFKTMSLNSILDEVKTLSHSDNKRMYNFVVITGGEPLRQPIESLCERLIKDGYVVQIETNGTLFRNINSEVKIVCSPKNQGQGYNRIRPDLLPRINALKFIASASNPSYMDIAEVGQSEYKIPVYVQPMDEHDKEKNKKNLDLAIKISRDKGCLLSIQTHKIIGIK